jgi:hypothetical protein
LEDEVGARRVLRKSLARGHALHATCIETRVKA